MTAQHTPGPWTVEQATNPDGSDTIVECGALVVAECYPDRFAKANMMPEYGACQANARLIAAAPDMLAALQDLVHSIEEDDTEDDLERQAPNVAWSIKNMARAAIAKAEGK